MEVALNSNRITECKDMEEYHTACSLKAMKEGNVLMSKDHARKAQSYRQEADKLQTYADRSDR